MSTPLSNQDVAKLLTDPSPQSRIDTAAKIATGFSDGALTGREKHLAEEIFRIMLSDAEVRVRAALAANLKECVSLPHEVAIALANDVDDVALPMLSFSEVLSDEDLLAIIGTRNEQKQLAITQRLIVSEPVSSSLIEIASETVVSSLVANEGAQIADVSFEKAVERLGKSEKVQRAMIDRSALPIAVAEKLVTLVSDSMRNELVRTHELTADTATDLLLQSRERATVVLSSEAEVEDVRILVKQLRQNGRLTASIVIRSLCMGDLRFFEQALSEMANIPLSNARTLIHDPGRTGLERLWVACKMPKPQLIAIHAALDASAELEYNGELDDREHYRRRLLELVLTQYDDLGVEFETGDLEYLLAKMADLPVSINQADQISGP